MIRLTFYSQLVWYVCMPVCVNVSGEWEGVPACSHARVLCTFHAYVHLYIVTVHAYVHLYIVVIVNSFGTPSPGSGRIVIN